MRPACYALGLDLMSEVGEQARCERPGDMDSGSGGVGFDRTLLRGGFCGGVGICCVEKVGVERKMHGGRKIDMQSVGQWCCVGEELEGRRDP